MLTLLGMGQAVNAASIIRAPTEDSEIVISTSVRCAGAIDSLTWRGKQFLDSFDHGRELQSASNLDLGTPITGETYNPTEAGSRDDGTGIASSSRLLSLRAHGSSMESTIQMAFWLSPGETSGGNVAKNRSVLSNHLLSKWVKIGVRGRPHLIGYNVSFILPRNETHHHATFEALTGYMPADFNAFFYFDPVSRKLQPLSDGPGEQPNPVALATSDGAFAMGIYSPDRWTKGYGRFRFVPEQVVKWNCVFRVDHPRPGGKYTYHQLVAIGTLAQVQTELARLVPGQKP
jgi:hypothetical protein